MNIDYICLENIPLVVLNIMPGLPKKVRMQFNSQSELV